MLPGAAAMKKQIAQIDDREMVRVEAIIQSMTPLERENPKVLDGSRRSRIARGSGTKVSDVNSLVDRFSQAQKMMKQMGKGGLPKMPGQLGQSGLPGLTGMPGAQGMPNFAGPKQGSNQAKPKKSRSGNPAKRAQEEGR
jgi:signal recognition particle subunit SRP54